MERTTVFLDPALKRRLHKAALQRKSSEASLIREALERFLEDVAPKRRIRTLGRSTDGGVARDVDAALSKSGFGE